MNLVLSFPLKLDQGIRGRVDRRGMQPFNTEVEQEARGIHSSPEQLLHLEPVLGRPCSSYMATKLSSLEGETIFSDAPSHSKCAMT